MAKQEEKIAVESSVPEVKDQASALIARAIDKGATVETMEKLMAMRRELRAEAAREIYFSELAFFQAECPVIGKSSQVDYASNTGGRVKYRYAPLDVIVKEVRGPLQAHGFSYTITTRQEQGNVTAICHAHHKDGHTEETSFAVPIDTRAKMNAAQQVASALTYAKRYAFCNAFGILTGDEDDDALGSVGAQSDGVSEGTLSAKTVNMPKRVSEKPTEQAPVSTETPRKSVPTGKTPPRTQGKSEARKTAPKAKVDEPKKTDQERRVLMRQWIFEMMQADYPDASKEDIALHCRDYLHTISTFEARDGKVVEGKESLNELEGKRLEVNYHKVEKEYEDFKSGVKDAEVTSPSEEAFNELMGENDATDNDGEYEGPSGF